MELQIPLILFTSLLAWAGGIFASQGVLAIAKQGQKAQLASLATAFVVLVAGGVAVLFHLAQPLHIFNGFGNPTSGITQELVAIVLIVVMMVVYYAMLRQSKDGNVPAWCGVVAIVLALALDVVMAHSYMMPSRPVWDSLFQVLSIVGASCIAGPATVALICSFKDDDAAILSPLNLGGTIIGAVTTIGYICAMNAMSSRFVSLGNYFDPTHPNGTLRDGSIVTSMSGSAVVPMVIAIVAVVVAVACAVWGGRKRNWKVPGAIIVVCGVVSAIALRIVFYDLGYAALMFY